MYSALTHNHGLVLTILESLSTLFHCISLIKLFIKSSYELLACIYDGIADL